MRGVGTVRAAGNLPPGRGRGSSVSSIVCYLIGLSHVDPLAHGLFLGRFLNDEMSSVPDIDLDFPRDIREQLIERVYQEYGPERAALVCAFATYKLRSAVRDVGKALGVPLTDLDQIAKLCGSRSARDLYEELGRIPAYVTRRDSPPWTHLVELAAQLAGFPRHVSQHVGGMVVSSEPLVELVPVQPAAMEGRFICQWDKDSCDDARFIKIDFLALGMLSLVEECLELIVNSGKEPVDLSRIDFDDKAVYDMICAGDTIGVFQIESRAQIQMLPRTLPRNLEDLVVQVAIIRPGPIVGGAVTSYVQSRAKALRYKNFRPALRPPHPRADAGETLGVILYQEQVLEVSMALAGFSAGQAEGLRRAMSRKRSHEAMAFFWTRFRDGALERGVPRETAKEVFRKLLGFAEYGFPKSHSAAFAVLAYQSAWLKQYHPAEFACALFNNQPMGFYPPHVLTQRRQAARRARAAARHQPQQRALHRRGECRAHRSGLRRWARRGRRAGDPAGAGRSTATSARWPISSGACRIRKANRPRASASSAPSTASAWGGARRSGSWGSSSRRGVTDGKRRRPASSHWRCRWSRTWSVLPPMSPWEQMAADYHTLKLSPHYHPMGLLRSHLPEEIVTTEELETMRDGSEIRIAGLVVCRQRPGTAKGITFLLLEDERGLVNVIVFPALYEEQRLLVRAEPFLVVEGRLQSRHDTINVIATRLHTLEMARQAFVNAPARDFIIGSRPLHPPAKIQERSSLRELSPTVA